MRLFSQEQKNSATALSQRRLSGLGRMITEAPRSHSLWNASYVGRAVCLPRQPPPSITIDEVEGIKKV